VGTKHRLRNSMLLMHPEMQFGGIVFSAFCPRVRVFT
jgi:hypothetical protein